ncbi:MAG: hypothetical protein AAFW67_11750 [Cyanobacteria bacterium J06638_38]
MIENKVNKELESKIELYLNGKLNEHEVDELWGELIQDDYYIDYLKTVANLKEVILEKKRTSTTTIFSLRKYAGYAATAAAVLLMGIIGVFNYQSNTGVNQSPIAEIELNIIRGADDAPAAEQNETIKKAIQMATDGEVMKAVELLQSAINEAREPQLIADLALTQGSIQYNYGDYEASVNAFKLVTSQSGIETLTSERGYWFLGNAYFQLDQLELAQEAFQNAYDLNGAYSRVAKSYVEALAKSNN